MMAAPPQYLDGLPSMFKDSKADPFRSTMGATGFRRHAQPSPAMSIPGSHDQHDVPPPLPPPRFLPSFHKDPNPFANGFSPRDDRPDYMRRVKAEHHDEGYASMSTASTRSSQGLPSLSEFGLSHMQFSSSIDDYDKDIKRKLDPIKTFSTASPTSRSLLSASMNEPSTRRYAPETRLAPLSMPSALPFHTRNPTFDSPSRYTETPLSALSPRSAPFSATSDYRSPHDAPDFDRSPRYRSRRANSGSVPDDVTVSTQGSGSGYGEDDMDIDSAEPPASSISRLRIDDYHHSLPQKRRRAQSPPGEDQPTIHNMPSQGDLFRQRNLASRGSPTPRLSMQPASIASTMSTTSRSGSNFSVASSMTSYGRRSPNGLSPGGLSPVATEVSCSSPYMTPTSNPSPRTSLARRTTNCGGKMQSFHMCDCCPKKPKKFETEEELRAHEAEKQYECSFCGNRFKNKNEAERHQNSLHVRRHSWSCSALYAYDKAFHESTNRPGEADTCGYCGEEFGRSGRPGAGGARTATDEDWVERNRHLQEVHKFRECNSSKKFYRADHFRQHLKHSHQGTSGKWTNMLENACMMEEEPPMPR